MFLERSRFSGEFSLARLLSAPRISRHDSGVYQYGAGKAMGPEFVASVHAIMAAETHGVSLLKQRVLDRLREVSRSNCGHENSR
jgi:hypothetical protein